MTGLEVRAIRKGQRVGGAILEVATLLNLATWLGVGHLAMALLVLTLNALMQYVQQVLGHPSCSDVFGEHVSSSLPGVLQSLDGAEVHRDSRKV